MNDRNSPRLIIYNEADAPLVIYYVETLYVPIDCKEQVRVNFKDETTVAIRKGRANIALLHMPERLYRVEFNFKHNIGYINKGDEITISEITLPL